MDVRLYKLLTLGIVLGGASNGLMVFNCPNKKYDSKIEHLVRHVASGIIFSVPIACIDYFIGRYASYGALASILLKTNQTTSMMTFVATMGMGALIGHGLNYTLNRVVP